MYSKIYGFCQFKQTDSFFSVSQIFSNTHVRSTMARTFFVRTNENCFFWFGNFELPCDYIGVCFFEFEFIGIVMIGIICANAHSIWNKNYYYNGILYQSQKFWIQNWWIFCFCSIVFSQNFRHGNKRKSGFRTFFYLKIILDEFSLVRINYTIWMIYNQILYFLIACLFLKCHTFLHTNCIWMHILWLIIMFVDKKTDMTFTKQLFRFTRITFCNNESALLLNQFI